MLSHGANTINLVGIIGYYGRKALKQGIKCYHYIVVSPMVDV